MATRRLIKTYKKKLWRLGGSRAVILPAWWLGGAREVELRVYIDRIEIRKIEEKGVKA